MKAKVERGGGFRGVLDYALGKEGGNACEVIGGNMCGLTPQELANEFRLSREARPGVVRPVWHTSLTLPAGDSLTPDRWSEVVADFMAGMGLADHQHVVIRHHDTDLDHVHIIASRISLDGAVWHGRFEAKKAIALTQELEERYGLTRTKGPGEPAPAKPASRKEIEMSVRTGQAPSRLVLQQIIDAATAEPGSVFEFYGPARSGRCRCSSERCDDRENERVFLRIRRNPVQRERSGEGLHMERFAGPGGDV